MASRAFPAPPDISEILKFFAASPETHARVPRPKVSSSRQPRSGERQRSRDDAAGIGYHQLKQQQERFYRKPHTQRKDNNGSKDAPDERSPPPAPGQNSQAPDFGPHVPATSTGRRGRCGRDPLGGEVDHNDHSVRLKRHQAGQRASSAASRVAATEQQQSLKPPPDARAHDGIQTLLMYRKEVEKRLSLDPTYYTKPQ